jgi:hypothetical protein
MLAAYSASEGGNPNDPDGLVMLWSSHTSKAEYRFHCQVSNFMYRDYICDPSIFNAKNIN